MIHTASQPRKRSASPSYYFFPGVLACLAAIAIAVTLTRSFGLHFRVSFILISLASLVALVLATLALRALLNGRPDSPGEYTAAWASIIVGVTPFFVLLSYGFAALNLPQLYDISTDTETPPPLLAAASLRTTAHHSTAYPGTESAHLQRQFYPEIMSLRTSRSPADLADKTRLYIQQQHWELITDARENRLIEAVVTTPLFGFKDDFVVRIEDAGDYRIVDARSASRLGKSDLGTNAKRVLRYLAAMEQ